LVEFYIGNKRHLLVSFDQVGLKELPRIIERQFSNALDEIAKNEKPKIHLTK